jgi:hypothetical protein
MRYSQKAATVRVSNSDRDGREIPGSYCDKFWSAWKKEIDPAAKDDCVLKNGIKCGQITDSARKSAEFCERWHWKESADRYSVDLSRLLMHLNPRCLFISVVGHIYSCISSASLC